MILIVSFEIIKCFVSHIHQNYTLSSFGVIDIPCTPSIVYTSSDHWGSIPFLNTFPSLTQTRPPQINFSLSKFLPLHVVVYSFFTYQCSYAIFQSVYLDCALLSLVYDSQMILVVCYYNCLQLFPVHYSNYESSKCSLPLKKV